MAHVESYKLAAVRALGAHFSRTPDKNGEYTCFRNRDIDKTRTHLNYNLAAVQEVNHLDFVKHRMTEVTHVKRDNLNVMSVWILTLPKGFSDEKGFFEESYKFLENRYGKENVISAYVHKDEAQPHMHFAFVPVKDNRLSASKVLNYHELMRFHPELKTHLDRELKQDVGVLNGATAGGNRTVAEMKANRDTIKAEEISAKAELFIRETEIEMRVLVTKKEELQKELSILEGKILTKREVNALKASKGITGSLKGISFSDFEALANTARLVEEVRQENAELKEKIKDVEERIDVAETKAKKALNEKPSIELVKQNAILKSKLTNMERRLNNLSDRAPEKYQRAIDNILSDRNPFDYQQAQHIQNSK